MRAPILLGGAAAAIVFLMQGHPVWAAIAFGTGCAAATFVPPPGLDPERAFSEADKQTLMANAGGRCQKCGKPVHRKYACPAGECPLCFHADHKYPHSKGGRTVLSNGACLCRKCNLEKGART